MKKLVRFEIRFTPKNGWEKTEYYATDKPWTPHLVSIPGTLIRLNPKLITKP